MRQWLPMCRSPRTAAQSEILQPLSFQHLFLRDDRAKAPGVVARCVQLGRRANCGSKIGESPGRDRTVGKRREGGGRELL
jgi:hypothetical protein